MAEAAVVLLVGKLKTVLSEEVKILSRITAQVEDMVNELEHIQAFLRVADAKEDNDPQLKVWVKQVRDVAHEMEDAFDKFRLFHSQDHSHGFRASLRKLSSIIKKWKANHQISADIQRLQSKVQKLSEGHIRYQLYDQGQPCQFDQVYYLTPEEDELVGIHKRKEELIEMLMKDDFQRKVVSVVGMGGLGKTTLIKQVYKDARVRNKFKVHAWITVSRSYKINQLLKQLIHEIYQVLRRKVPEDELTSMHDYQLIERIRDLLQNTSYLLVLDDLWHISDWAAFNQTLPNNNCGSQVMLTTRNINVASASCLGNCGMIYRLEPLSPKDSWTLFCRKIFQENSCPPHLEEICQSILRKCRGLPLALVAIGAVLALKNKEIVEEWITIYRSIGAEIEGNDQLDSMKKLLYLSVSDLPYHLKSCFLYLSVFPDNYRIEHMRIIRLWLAEGFVIERQGMTPEEAAEGYLRELLQRSLVHAEVTETDGRVKSYSIHDLLREIAILKSREQNFAAIETEHTILPAKVRRLSIVDLLPNVNHTRKTSQLRSLLIFGVEKLITDFSIEKLFPNNGLQFLTVLDFEGADLEMFPSEVVKLLLLKYLSLRGTKVKQIPSSIKKLQYLETLDLKHSHVVELPAAILNLKRLRHLLVYRYEVESYERLNVKHGVKVPAGICGLQSLQKLCFIEAQHDDGDLMAKLCKMTQLRRLGILDLREKDGRALCFSIQHMTNLRALSVSSAHEYETIDLSHISCVLVYLQRLYLTGHLKNIHWISSTRNLVRLKLKWSRLTEDPLIYLERLPNLVHLELIQAHDGAGMHFAAGGFPSLILLRIGSHKLQRVVMDKGAMPRLEKLIMRCELLKKVPAGIEHLTNLSLLEFLDMPDDTILPLHPGGEDHWKVAHVAEVYYSSHRGGDWNVFSLVNEEFNLRSPAMRRLQRNPIWTYPNSPWK